MTTWPTSHFELLFTSVNFKTSPEFDLQEIECARIPHFYTKTRFEEEVKSN